MTTLKHNYRVIQASWELLNLMQGQYNKIAFVSSGMRCSWIKNHLIYNKAQRQNIRICIVKEGQCIIGTSLEAINVELP